MLIFEFDARLLMLNPLPPIRAPLLGGGAILNELAPPPLGGGAMLKAE